MQVSEIRVSEAIGRTLVERGVEVCFGLAGSGNFGVLNALHAAGASFYSSRHECGAVAMADDYTRASGKLGVVSVHQGPGFTNTLTGLTKAAKCRTPLLVLAADTPPAPYGPTSRSTRGFWPRPWAPSPSGSEVPKPQPPTPLGHCAGPRSSAAQSCSTYR